MINETILRIEQDIRTNKTLSEERKNELLGLVAQLKTEIENLEDECHEDAKSIARYTESSLHEAIREHKNPELLKHSLEGMSLSVRQFEASHPTLVGVINSIGRTLSNIGI